MADDPGTPFRAALADSDGPREPIDAMSLLRWVFWRQRRTIALGMVAGIGWMGSLAAIPIAIGAAVAHISGGRVLGVLPWAGVAACAALGEATSGIVRNRAATLLAFRTRWLLERVLSRRLLDPGGGIDQAPGALLSLATNDTSNIGGMVQLLCRGTGAVVVFCAVGAIMIARAPTLGIVALLGLPPCMAVLAPLWRPLKRRSTNQQVKLAEASRTASDTLAGLRVVKGVGGEPAVRRWFAEGTSRIATSAVSQARLGGGWSALSGLVPGLFVAMVLWVAGGLSLHGHISAGTLVAFTGLALFIETPLSTFAEVGSVWATGLASAGRVAAMLASPIAVTPGCDTAVAGGSIELEDVACGPVRSLELHVAGGELVGFVATGTDIAATLTKLLGRRVDPSSGLVRLGGIDARSLTLEALRSHVLVIEADDWWLMGGTLGQNLTLAAPQAPRESLVAALSAAGGEDLLDDADGLDRSVGERGAALSGGQRQRLVVARGLVADPPILVLSNPTTALDAVTEQRLVSGIRSQRAGRTTLVVTTSPAFLALCDRIVFVDREGAVACGRHWDLLESFESYRMVLNGGS